MPTKDATRYAQKKARGECQRCSNPALPGRTRCEEHARYSSRWSTEKLKRGRGRVLTALGCSCARCGIYDARVLQLDHINGGGLAEARRFGTNGWATNRKYQEHILNNPENYQLLCANCHLIKGLETGTQYANSKRVWLQGEQDASNRGSECSPHAA